MLVRLLLLSALVAITSYVAAAQESHRVVFDAWYHSRQPDSDVPEWKVLSEGGSTREARIERAPRRIRLLGRYGNADTLRLNLDALPRHQRLRISIGLHIIGSWDGVHDDDKVLMLANGTPFLDASFSNTIYRQTYPAIQNNRTYPPRTGARNRNMLGYRFVEPGVYDGAMDATYEVSAIVEHTASSLVLDVTARLRDVHPGIDNESWGIEHVTVGIEDRVTDSERPVPSVELPVEDAIRYNVTDERVVAGYTQDEDFPDLPPGSPLERDLHLTILRSECNSCGDACLTYVYTVYSDRWVNVWSNKPAKGISSWNTQLSEVEYRQIRDKVDMCLALELQREYHDAAIEEANPGITHCQLLLRDLVKEQSVLVHAGEPQGLRELMQLVMRTLAGHGWIPIPH